MIFSANYFGFDDVVTIDGERTGDRIAAIPFQELPDIPPAQFSAKQREFKKVVDSEEKPVELLIGEIGDFLLSDEFIEKRNEFAELLLEKCEDTIKIRTLLNYGVFYAVLWKLYFIFEGVWREKVSPIVLFSFTIVLFSFIRMGTVCTMWRLDKI